MKADSKGREDFKGIAMGPMRVNFGLTRTICNMGIGSPPQVHEVAFSTVAEHISTHDLVQKFLTIQVLSTLFGWGMSKVEKTTRGNATGGL